MSPYLTRPLRTLEQALEDIRKVKEMQVTFEVDRRRQLKFERVGKTIDIYLDGVKIAILTLAEWRYLQKTMREKEGA